MTSKGLSHNADVLETIRGAYRFRIGVPEEVRIDWASIVQHTAQPADRTAEAIEEESRASEDQTGFKGETKFVDHKTIEVNGAQIQGETIVIAVGARPVIPPIPGLDTVLYLTS